MRSTDDCRPFRPAQRTLDVWRQVLAEAQDVPAVLSTVRDFLARWSPEEIAQLPADCRPHTVKSEDEVSSYAFHLLQQQFRHADEAVGLIKMSAFFAAAAQRIAELRAVTAADLASDDSWGDNGAAA